MKNSIRLFLLIVAATSLVANTSRADFTIRGQNARYTIAWQGHPSQIVDPNTVNSPYGGVGSLAIGQAGLCSGVAISRRHILTAAHCFDFDGNGVLDQAPEDITFFLNFGGDLSHSFAGRSIALHPQWHSGRRGYDDLAVLTLATPIPIDVPIYSLFTSDPQINTIVDLVGYGASSSNGTSYNIPGDGIRKRSSPNNVEGFDFDDEGSGSLELFAYQYDFDIPNEGIAGPGDSGGPAFVDNNGNLEIWGINTFGFGNLPVINQCGAGGIVVSSYADWINSVIVPEPSVAPFVLISAICTLVGSRRNHRRRS